MVLQATPERLCTGEFKRILRTVHENNNFNRLVVDEVGDATSTDIWRNKIDLLS